MKLRDFSIDRSARLSTGGVHDAVVEEFHFISGQSLNIRLRGASGEHTLVSFHGTVKLGFKDVLEGTIVSDIFCWRMHDKMVIEGVLDEAFRVLQSGHYHEAGFYSFSMSLAQKHTGKFLVFLSSSYGGEMAAVCEEIQIFDL